MTDLHVILHEPEIHWNTGNVGRTCLATGAQLHLVEPVGFSLDDKAVRRAGLDYWAHVDPRVWKSWPDLEAGFAQLADAYYVSPDGPHLFWTVEYARPTVLVFGKESVGLPPSLRSANRDRLVRIPIADDHVRSLNLSTCVGIVLYEVLRQRNR